MSGQVQCPVGSQGTTEVVTRTRHVRGEIIRCSRSIALFFQDCLLSGGMGGSESIGFIVPIVAPLQVVTLFQDNFDKKIKC